MGRKEIINTKEKQLSKSQLRRVLIQKDYDWDEVVRILQKYDKELKTAVLQGKEVGYDGYAWECSNCGALWALDNPKEHSYNYCPNCGVKFENIFTIRRNNGGFIKR